VGCCSDASPMARTISGPHRIRTVSARWTQSLCSWNILFNLFVVSWNKVSHVAFFLEVCFRELQIVVRYILLQFEKLIFRVWWQRLLIRLSYYKSLTAGRILKRFNPNSPKRISLRFIFVTFLDILLDIFLRGGVAFQCCQ
jgi:hypothetical protein